MLILTLIVLLMFLFFFYFYMSHQGITAHRVNAFSKASLNCGQIKVKAELFVAHSAHSLALQLPKLDVTLQPIE